MFKTLIAIILIIMMCGIASAELVEDWPHEQRNVMPDYIEGVMYDFEEGSNCADFKNQYPEIATFLTVLGTQPYGTSDWPSYVTVGGSTCGNTRCYMRIYPWCGHYNNGTPFEYVFVVNGRSAFSPMTGPDHMGGFWPGMKSHIVFKEDTRYVSFLATTSGNMYVNLFDRHGDRIHSEKITVTILREGTNPSNFTQFSYHSDVDIVSMKISGPFNGNHLDDLIIGGAPGYLPEVIEPVEPVDYSDVAELAKEYIGAKYCEHCLGFDYRDFTYADPVDIIFPPSNCAPGLNCQSGMEYWNPDIKQFVYGEGISDEGLVISTFNSVTKELYGESVVKWETVPDMIKHDFTVPVPVGEEQPGDVYAMFGGKNGAVDEIGIVIDDDYVITSRPDIGVIYVYKPMIEGIDTSNPDFAGYYRLPGKITGGHNPIKKAPQTKYTPPEDYSYVEGKAIELAESNTPIPYNQHALGYDYPTLSYTEVEWLTDDSLDYFIPHPDGGGSFASDIEAHTGEDIDTSGISPEGLILWTYNYDSYNEYGKVEVNWYDLPQMIERDFTEAVAHENVQLGDVYFWDSNGDSTADRAGISVTPNEAGMDMITVTPDGGVHYNYGDAVTTMPGFIGVYRIVNNMR